MLHVTRLLLFPGIYKQPLEPTMTLRVQTSTHRACLLCVTWRLARVNPFHQTHLSQRPGGYRTQVCCSYWFNQTESTDCCQESGSRPCPAHSWLVPVAFRCRVVASWGLSEVRRGRSVWPREHGDGAFAWPSGNDWRQRADAKPHVSGNVPGPVEDVHGYGALLRGYVPSLIFDMGFFWGGVSLLKMM